MLETPPGRDCFGVVEVYPDRLVVKGVDTFAGGEWVLGGGQGSGADAGPPGQRAQRAGAGAAGAGAECGGGALQRLRCGSLEAAGA